MEPNDAASSSARAQELRASLGARREVEALLAQASATREAAAAEADALIEEAQQVSEQLLTETRAEVDAVAADARHRAEGLLAHARSEAEDITRQARVAADAVRARAEAQVEEHRLRVRAEVTEQVTREVTDHSRRELAVVHERQQAMIGDLEASVRILGVSMEAAVANIAEMLAALDSLRAHTAGTLGEAAPARTAEPIDHLIRSTALEPPAEPVLPPAAAPEPAVGQPFDEGGSEDDLAVEEPDEGLVEGLVELDELDEEPAEHQPQSAVEAFLLSSHLDHGDPPLPPTDDREIGARYARDAMRATARARTRRDEETLEVLPERAGASRPGPDEREADGAEPSGRPLGWLFRSP